MNKAVFYHAGCPVCVSAEQELVSIINKEVSVEVVHLGEDRGKILEAEKAGIESVPALVLSSGQVLHINYGASLDEVKNG